jgi:carbonic anhydrase
LSTIHDGVKTFQETAYPGLSAHFESLKDGQAPHSLFITCSDSRIDPSLITQSRPGSIFVSRNAGNLVPPEGQDVGTASAVEYAVAALKVERIVVCGHSGCGAMGGLMTPGSLETLPFVAQWVEHAACTREALGSEGTVDQAIRHNAIQQLANLRTLAVVEDAIQTRGLVLEAWVYDIASGQVDVVGTSGGAA